MIENFKKYGLILLKMLVVIFIGIFIVTIFNFFNIFNKFVLELFKILIPAISILIGGFKIGKLNEKKGYVAGIIFGFITIIMMILINLIFIKGEFNMKYLIYLLTFIVISMFGGIIGINKKEKN